MRARGQRPQSRILDTTWCVDDRNLKFGARLHRRQSLFVFTFVFAEGCRPRLTVQLPIFQIKNLRLMTQEVPLHYILLNPMPWKIELWARFISNSEI